MFATYEQRTGLFIIHEVEDGGLSRVLYECFGYAGAGGCKNNPYCDELKNRGPLPRGEYAVELVDHPAYAAPVFFLRAALTNVMHGRSGFLIHGDSRTHPGAASRGCIVLSKRDREAVEHYRVRRLVVSPGEARAFHKIAAGLASAVVPHGDLRSPT